MFGIKIFCANNNSIRSLKRFFGKIEMDRLNELSFTNNKINDISGLEHICSNIKFLHLSHNEVKKIPDITKMQTLREIDLSYNQID